MAADDETPDGPNYLEPGDKLHEGDWLYSSNGNFRLGLRDGQMVVEDTNTEESVFEVGDDEVEADEIRFEDDGGGGRGQNTLELHRVSSGDSVNGVPEPAAGELWQASPDTGEEGGAAENLEGQWVDHNDLSPERFYLTDDGQIVAVNDELSSDEGAALNSTSEHVIWYNEDIGPRAGDAIPSAEDRSDSIEVGDILGKDEDLLSLEIPDGDLSKELLKYLNLANHQLSWLSKQMGTSNPESLDPLLSQDHNPFDDNLNENENGDLMYEILGDRPAEGATAEAFTEAGDRVSWLADEWGYRDAEFERTMEALTADRADTYRSMYHRVQLGNEVIEATTLGLKQSDGAWASREWASAYEALGIRMFSRKLLCIE